MADQSYTRVPIVKDDDASAPDNNEQYTRVPIQNGVAAQATPSSTSKYTRVPIQKDPTAPTQFETSTAHNPTLPEEKGQSTPGYLLDAVTPDSTTMKRTGQGVWEGLGNIAKSVYQGGKDVLNYATSADSHPLIAPGPGTIAEKLQGDTMLSKYVLSPAAAEKAKAEREAQAFHDSTGMVAAGHAAESLGHTAAEFLPIIGPIAAHLGEKAGTGDIAGAAGEGTTYALAPKVTEKAVGAVPKIIRTAAKPWIEAAEAVTGKSEKPPFRPTTAYESMHPEERRAPVPEQQYTGPERRSTVAPGPKPSFVQRIGQEIPRLIGDETGADISYPTKLTPIRNPLEEFNDASATTEKTTFDKPITPEEADQSAVKQGINPVPGSFSIKNGEVVPVQGSGRGLIGPRPRPTSSGIPRIMSDAQEASGTPLDVEGTAPEHVGDLQRIAHQNRGEAPAEPLIPTPGSMRTSGAEPTAPLDEHAWYSKAKAELDPGASLSEVLDKANKMRDAANPKTPSNYNPENDQWGVREKLEQEQKESAAEPTAETPKLSESDQRGLEHRIGKAAANDTTPEGLERAQRLTKGTHQDFADFANEQGPDKPGGGNWEASDFSRKGSKGDLSPNKQLVIDHATKNLPHTDFMKATESWGPGKGGPGGGTTSIEGNSDELIPTQDNSVLGRIKRLGSHLGEESGSFGFPGTVGDAEEFNRQHGGEDAVIPESVQGAGEGHHVNIGGRTMRIDPRTGDAVAEAAPAANSRELQIAARDAIAKQFGGEALHRHSGVEEVSPQGGDLIPTEDKNQAAHDLIGRIAPRPQVFDPVESLNLIRQRLGLNSRTKPSAEAAATRGESQQPTGEDLERLRTRANAQYTVADNPSQHNLIHRRAVNIADEAGQPLGEVEASSEDGINWTVRHSRSQVPGASLGTEGYEKLIRSIQADVEKDGVTRTISADASLSPSARAVWDTKLSKAYDVQHDDTGRPSIVLQPSLPAIAQHIRSAVHTAITGEVESGSYTHLTSGAHSIVDEFESKTKDLKEAVHELIAPKRKPGSISSMRAPTRNTNEKEAA